jgi:hypothetical protein
MFQTVFGLMWARKKFFAAMKGRSAFAGFFVALLSLIDATQIDTSFSFSMFNCEALGERTGLDWHGSWMAEISSGFAKGFALEGVGSIGVCVEGSG